MSYTQRQSYASFSGNPNKAHKALCDHAYAIGYQDGWDRAKPRTVIAHDGRELPLWGDAKAIYTGAYLKAKRQRMAAND